MKTKAIIAALSLFASYAADAGPLNVDGPDYGDRAAPVHFREATLPAQVFGCVNLGEFKAPDKAFGAMRRLQDLHDAGMDTALLISTDGGAHHFIAYRCKK